MYLCRKGLVCMSVAEALIRETIFILVGGESADPWIYWR